MLCNDRLVLKQLIDEKYLTTAVLFCKFGLSNVHALKLCISLFCKENYIFMHVMSFFCLFVYLNVSNKPTYQSKLRVQTKSYEHEEEQDGPQRRYRKFGKNIRVSNEGQSKLLKCGGKQTYSYFLVIPISQSMIQKCDLFISSKNMKYTSKYSF